MGGIHHPLSSILVATKSEIFKDDIEKSRPSYQFLNCYKVMMIKSRNVNFMAFFGVFLDDVPTSPFFNTHIFE